MTFDEASERLTHCDSFSRLPTLLEIHWQLPDADFLRLLGMEWSGFDNVGHHIDDLLLNTAFGWQLEPDADVKREMMNPDEQAAYDTLPDFVTIYRGCYAPNKWGLSWSMSRETAERFPLLNRYRQPGQALLVTAQAKKENIIAVKLDREETEIITWRPKHISTRHIKTLTDLTGAAVPPTH